jgi:hypothetical protein
VSTGAADSSFLAFVTFTIVLVVTPGSTTAVVVRNTLEGGRRAGYMTALGAALANTTIAIACGLGLSLLIAVWPGALTAIKFGGALFLAWLGVTSLYRAFRHHDGGIRMTIDPTDEPPRSHAGAYLGDGLAINLLSPVIISYYLSVVPTFIPVAASRFYYSMLAATHVSLALACHSLWATGLDAMRRWFIAPWTRRLLQAATGLALIGLALRILFGGSVPVEAASHQDQPTRVPVLAELFTSEGCNSCPPADNMLEILLNEQPIDGVFVIPMSEHVTYWDHQGWKDPFGSQQFTTRQQQYGKRFNLDSVYTPQLIIDGSREVIGSDKRAIERALRDAAKVKKPELSIELGGAGDELSLSASGAGLAIERNAELWFAITEDRLVVDVKRGENANKIMRHSGVVRVLRSAGQAGAKAPLSIRIAPDWRRENLHVVAFVQSTKDRRILSVAIRDLERS